MPMESESVVIVGSGPTGIMAALTLVRAGIPTVMLESGHQYSRNIHLRVNHREIRRPVTPPIREYAQSAEFTNLHDCSARWIKAHCLGGRSNFWSGIVLRYSEKDFKEGGKLHSKYEWPISYQDIEPYYDRVEQLIRVRGGTESCEALPACNVAYERKIGPEWEEFAHLSRKTGRSLAILPDVYGPSTIVSTIPTPQNVAIRLMKRLKQSKYFRLISNAHVTRLKISPHTSQAESVEYLNTKNHSLSKLSAKSIILAAGPLSSTQILLNSTSASFPNGIGNSQGILGRFLHDHPMEYITLETDFVYQCLNDREAGGLYLTREHYHQSHPLLTHALLLYGNHDQRRQVNLHKGLTLSNLRQSSAQSLETDKHYTSVCCFGTQIPRYENHVSLHPSHKDQYGLPLLQISTKFDQDELNNMKKGRELISELMIASGYKIFQFSSQLQPPGTSVHYGGTARMHHSPKYGVLDQWNRLHDIKNVLVVDASCFTTGVEKNPTLTAMAIAMRAADKLSRE